MARRELTAKSIACLISRNNKGNMTRLELHFSPGSSAQLRKAVFSHPKLSSPIVSVRGKGGGAVASDSSFQWTRAVQAFVLLVLDAKADGGVLEGEESTPAASLDYAISKQTAWLADMFGRFDSGALIYKRAFKRSNPERKRSGPVIVSLNQAFLPCENIKVIIGEAELTDERQLRVLRAAVKSQWYASSKLRIEERVQSPQNADELNGDDKFKELFRRLLTEECQLVMHATDIFNSRALKGNLAQLRSNPSVNGLSGDAEFISALDSEMLSSHRLGIVDEDMLRKYLCGSKPMRIASPAPGPAAAAIFVYLRDVKGYSLELDFAYPHAIEIAQRIIRSDFDQAPDAVVLGIAPAAQLLGLGGKSHYRPLMMLPKNSQRIISGGRVSGRAKTLGEADYFMLKDNPSNPKFYFDQLVRSGELREKRVSLSHMEPDEVFSTFKEADESVRAILFFPHYHLNQIFNKTQLVDRAGDQRQYKEMFLFVHDSIMRDRNKARCLDIAIRDAWLTIREQPRLMNQLIGRLVNDQLYLKFMRRACGLSSLRADIPKLGRLTPS